MKLKDKTTAASDDEDDLEKLRLAALQSLKRPAADEPRNITKNVNKSTQNQVKRRNFQGRNVRNRQFYNRPKNTNLIAIPTVDSDAIVDPTLKNNKSKYVDDVPKLILPQDRYCNSKSANDKPTEPLSKFDRYDNSDKSESESECESNSESESESPGKLEKTNSLEALMQELENEIHGEAKAKDDKVIKVHKIKKRKVKTNILEGVKDMDLKEGVAIENSNENIDTKRLNDGFNEIKDDKDKSDDIKDISTIQTNPDYNKSPPNRRFYKKYPERNLLNPTTSNFVSQPPYAPPVIFPDNRHFNQNLLFDPVAPFNNPLMQNPPLLPLNIPLAFTQPPTMSSFDRPLSPLSLNTNDVLTITRAPLSPRSAAFVLQNREIIERRKKSPRRSYSRSPSPRYRRSKSPPGYGRGNRSPSPRKFIKSKSRSPLPVNSEISRKLSPSKDKLEPIRRTPPPQERHSPAPRPLSPLRDRRSPLRTKISPHRQRHTDKRSPNAKQTTSIERSPKQNYKNSPKSVLRERLGNRTNKQNETEGSKGKKRSRSLSLSPEPDENKEKVQKVEKETVLDPILEARRKKFETNEIKNTEGIIRLKPKSENASENENIKETDEEILNEEELMDLLDTKVDDIFSDDETDEENEGRFKSSLNKPQRNVSVLPFTQLMDESTRNIKTGLVKITNQSASRGDVKERPLVNRSRKRRSRSPRSKEARSHKDRGDKSNDSKSTRKVSTKEKLYSRNRVLFRNGSSSRKEKPPVTAPIENKKIEIKIRNPAKYETTSKYDVANEHETLERLEKIVRKVEVTDAVNKSDDDTISEAEILNDNEDESQENLEARLNQKCEGDLRAQLSRKRAERQNKFPVPEDVQSRLLQNALQGAVFKKQKKSRKEKESAPKDGKLPIHLRLGFANSMEIFHETNSKRKRSKSKGRIDQV